MKSRKTAAICKTCKVESYFHQAGLCKKCHRREQYLRHKDKIITYDKAYKKKIEAQHAKLVRSLHFS